MEPRRARRPRAQAPSPCTACRCSIGEMSGVEPDLLRVRVRDGARERTICDAATLDHHAASQPGGCAGVRRGRRRWRPAAVRGRAGSRRGWRRATRSCWINWSWRSEMCETCGCGDTEHGSARGPGADPVGQRAAGRAQPSAPGRARRARHQPDGLARAPGKTAVLEATAQGPAPGGDWRRSPATSPPRTTPNACGRPASRREAITTGSACHLDAELVHRDCTTSTWPRWTTCSSRTSGNLVCPAVYDLGQACNVVALVGDRGRGQAAEVPGDVPQGRPGPDHEDGPGAAPRHRRRH